MYFFVTIVIAQLSLAFGLVGYDCGGQSLNVTTLSLLEVGRCDVPDLEPRKEEKYVQLLQLSDFDNTQAIQCRVEVDRTIYYCGMHSHISIVQNGRKQYLLDITHELCKQMQLNGMFTVGVNTQITGLKRNATDTRSVTLAGRIGVDGECAGTQYSDPYGTWDNVVVQASIKVTLQNYQTPIKISSSEIILRSGLHCKMQDGMCIDTDGAFTFWTPLPEDSCQFNSYDILYEGLATKLTPKESTTGPVIYTVTTRATTFALTQTSEFTICGYTILKTEHPKLFIMETRRDRSFKIHGRISVDNLDIFTYVNSKFIYVEKHIRTQITQLYKDIVQQKCALEQQILKNALSLATLSPDEVAFTIMKEPGYMSTVAGEVMHIIKCVPVQTKVRRTEQCYKELPVTFQNASYFLTPKSRILTLHGTVKECNELLPTMYKINNVWYRMSPQPVESISPPTIQPLSHPTWQYISPKNLATSGIYSEEDLNKLRDHIMFPIEKPAMLNTIARGAMGKEIPANAISMYNLFNEADLEKIAESTGEKLWSGFIKFGSATAGIMGIFIIIRIIKLIIDTIIHGYALHSIYGWSLHLLGAIWSSLTHLLMHLGSNRRTTAQQPSIEEGTPEEPQPAPRSAEKTSNEEAAKADDEFEKLKKHTLYYKELSERLGNASEY